ncbi:MAG: amidohydrolase family protein [Actinomycetota bacterium]|nr:amidohydrolase family protein [Actinomycetota bacterium]
MDTPTAGSEFVVRGGTLVDGTGGPRRRADVAVRNGRIVGIGTRLRAGGREIDASGRVVAPGFVDVHTHYDAQVFWDPDLTPSSHHGVTTVVAGNCGFSIAPARPEGVELLARTLQHVEDMNFDTLVSGVPWAEFRTFSQYLDAVERRGVGLNYACYVGHTAVRLYVMGDEAYVRPATPTEIDRMQAEVRDAMISGAIGFASSTASTHNGDGGRPVPSRVSDLHELEHLLAPLGELGRGVVSLLPGTQIPHNDMFRIQRSLGRPVTWTALVSSKGSTAHLEVTAAHERAQAVGIDVRPQVSCRPIVFQVTMAEPFVFNTVPSFSRLMGTTLDERRASYRDPEWRDEAWADMNRGARSFVDWDTLRVAESDAHPELIGRRVLDIARERAVRPLDVVLDLSLEERLATRFWSEVANNDPEVVGWLLRRDHVLLGLADSGAHVSQLCDACFATDFLGSWIRDKELLPLERAVQMLTGDPAAFFELTDRGTIELGKAADLVVFDPDSVAPGPLRRVRDFPANGERLTADAPLGVDHVFVNGCAIRQDGRPVSDRATRPGTVLRGSEAPAISGRGVDA